MTPSAGVSFVVPVHNGGTFVRDTLASIVSQVASCPVEIIVVEDRSSDDSAEILRQLSTVWPLRIVPGPGRGAAAALNAGVRVAQYPLIAQVDQDVVLHPGWLSELIAALDDLRVAAAQGCYATDRDASIFSRVMGLDLEERYAAIRGPYTDHVCTGNTVYRRDALDAVGLFDEHLGYGSDNDMSYRLREAGYRLAHRPAARSTHRWRDGLRGYVVQQYGFGYGRIDVVAKHPGRYGGDAVSPQTMMLHPVVMAFAIAAFVLGLGFAALELPWRPCAAIGLALVLALALERTIAGMQAWQRFASPVALLFPIVHLIRDVAWVSAVAVWVCRRATRRGCQPDHSMRPRRPAPVGRRATLPAVRPLWPLRTLAIVPAHNEAVNLPSVITDLRLHQPNIEILVVDDGSSDGTAEVLERLDVRRLRWVECRGVGAAIRAGLRYAVRSGFTAVVRVDADGQHHADDIGRLLAPIQNGEAEVVLGTRYAEPHTPRAGTLGFAQRLLAASITIVTRHSVTDPTSGFCAIGPHAIRLLAEHHPNGYPEPELRLFLSRNAVALIEVPVRSRMRLSGKTSLTAARVISAAARVLLALLIVPVRPAVESLHD